MNALDSRKLPLTPGVRTFRHARCYAPRAAMDVLRPVSSAAHLALVIDVDSLERSTLARIDRVMILALDALGQAGARIVLVASCERDRAARLLRMITKSACVDPKDGPVLERVRAIEPNARAAVITDHPDLLAELDPHDCGIVLGRPELASATVAVMADSAVRATLWWLLEERTRHGAA